MQWLTFPDPFSLDDIVGRYDSLSRSVSERNEKLQVIVTRSLSVQDGLDEMLDWMGGVERSLREDGQVPLNSAALQDIISKNIVSDLKLQAAACRWKQNKTPRFPSSISDYSKRVDIFMLCLDQTFH